MYKKSFLLGALFSISVAIFIMLVDTSKKSTTSDLNHKDSLEIALMDINFFPSSGTFPEGFLLNISQKGENSKKTLTDFKGKPTIVHAWSPGCPACVQEMPDFNAFSKDHSSNINIVPITTASHPEDIVQFYKKHDLKDIELCIDQDGIMHKLQVRALPTTIFYDAEGQEIGRILGAVDWTGEAGQIILKGLGLR